LPALSRFFISNERVLDCYSSRDLLWAITLSGAVEGGSVKSFTGIVELIEHAPKRVAGREWLITIKDLQPPARPTKNY
jgi:hypothetical protein